MPLLYLRSKWRFRHRRRLDHFSPGSISRRSISHRQSELRFRVEIPEGSQHSHRETEFQFKAGNLNFKSTSYQWLVVAGPKAQYKGFGTINSAGNSLASCLPQPTARSMVAATSTNSESRSGTKPPALSSTTIMGIDDNGNLQLELGGGSIVIHN